MQMKIFMLARGRHIKSGQFLIWNTVVAVSKLIQLYNTEKEGRAKDGCVRGMNICCCCQFFFFGWLRRKEDFINKGVEFVERS
jgi:hypothetical protein